LPQVKGYWSRHLRQGFIGLEEVPAYLAGLADRVEPRAEVLAGRMGSEGLNVEEYPASVYYDAVVYRGRHGGGLEALTKVTDMLEARYSWGLTTCLRFLVCGMLPEGFSRSYGVADLAQGHRGPGMGAIVLRVPVYADGDEVLRLFAQARAAFGRSGHRFGEKAAQAVVGAVEGILRGEKVAAIAGERCDDRRQAETFRKAFYQALAKVGPALGPPAVHPQGRKTKGAPACRPERP
jgi:hypothetical protein